MDITYQQLVKDHEIFRYRSWDEGNDIVSHQSERNIEEWSVSEGILVVEDATNDIVSHFKRTVSVITIDIFERIVRRSKGNRRMHDDRCQLRYRARVSKRELRIDIISDLKEEEANARKDTIANLSTYAYLLDSGEEEELRQSLNESTMTEHVKERSRIIRKCIRMIDAMMRLLDNPEASETREFVHKSLPFSPMPLRPNCRLTSIRKSYLRRVRRKGSA